MKKGFIQSLWLRSLAIAICAIGGFVTSVNAQFYTRTTCNDSYVQAYGQAGTTYLGQGDDVLFTLNLPFTFSF